MLQARILADVDKDRVDWKTFEDLFGPKFSTFDD